MGWQADGYHYSIGVLKDIAHSYDTIYDGLELTYKDITYATIYNPWALAEYRADFSMALEKLPFDMRSIVKKDMGGYRIRDYKLLNSAYRTMTATLNGD